MNISRKFLFFTLTATVALLFFARCSKPEGRPAPVPQPSAAVSPKPAAAPVKKPPEEAECPDGQFRPRIATDGCCWPMQDWDGQHCTGIPVCSGILSVDLKAGACVVTSCLPGATRASEKSPCCWPGQTTDANLNGCQGQPQCPAWTTLYKGGCQFSDWRLIRAGSFTMGCVAGDNECGAEEHPPHRVTISHDFTMMDLPVTVRQFRAYSSESHAAFPTQPGWNGEDHPVVNVTWEEAGRFCGWLHGRLPTEAEWEFAARGRSDSSKYPYGQASHYAVNYWGEENKDQWSYTSPVGAFGMKNDYGLLDISGNASEWVADGYLADYYAHSPAADPVAPDSDGIAATRGGSWRDMPRDLRTSARAHEHKITRKDTVGFRCVQDYLNVGGNN